MAPAPTIGLQLDSRRDRGRGGELGTHLSVDALPALIGVAALAVAIVGQGAYYVPVQVVVGIALAAAAAISMRWGARTKDDLGLPAIWVGAALAGWSLVSAGVGGGMLGGLRYALLIGGAVVLVVICRRADLTQREGLVDAVIALAALAALSGWVGVAWRTEPWALEHQGLWRAATTLTYANASAALLAVGALLSLARIAAKPRSVGTALAACLLLTALGATLSRGGAVALLAGAAVLAWLLGPRRLAWAACPAVLGAAVALAALLPSVPSTSAIRPALAVLGFAAGLALCAALTRARTRTLPVLAVGAVLACSLAFAAGGVEVSALDRIADARLGTSDSVRGEIAESALELAGDHVIAGVGPGEATFASVGPGGQPRISQYAHNEYLQTLAELGAIGLGLTFALMAAVAVTVSRGRAVTPPPTWAGVVAALAAVAVHSAFDFLWHVPAVVLVCAVLVGIASPIATNEGTVLQ